MQKESKITHQGWKTQCILKLEQGGMVYRPDTERWIFCLYDKDNNEIYRDDIVDTDILTGNITQVGIDLKNLRSGKPLSYMLWPRLVDGTFTEKRHFPLPQNFLLEYDALFEWILSKPIPEKTVTCFIFGGLANQLFQIMATVVFAKQNGHVPIIYDDMEKSPSMVQDQDSYWDKIFSEVVKLGESYRYDTREQHIYADPSFTYAEIPRVFDHLKLYGYFTSYKYIDPERDYILSLIDSSNGLTDEVDRAFTQIIQQIPKHSGKLVSVHVRRGDSLKNETLKKLSLNYYSQAMNHFKGATFLVFSDDMAWCKKFLPKQNVFFVENQMAHVDMLLMARCDHHIIANSTFSWWGAYLNKSLDKKVIYPLPWFVGEKASRDLSDFLYPDWVAYPA